MLFLILLPLVVAQPPGAPIMGPRVQNPPQSLFQARATSADELDPCQYMLQNLTSIENLREHEFASLEQCLYYFLAGETASKMKKFNQITLQHFELNEFLKDIAIHGYMEVNWMDDRLMWNTNTWKMDKLHIQSLNHIWFPIFVAQNQDTVLKNGDALEMRRIDASSNGNVSAIIAFSLRTFCDDSDFENYPDDIYKCCFSLESRTNPDIIEFDASGLPIFTDPKYFRDYGWKLSGTVPQTMDDPEQVAQLGFCINLQRASSSVRIELTVPLLITSLIFLLTPFLAQIKLQIFTKMFILFLQFVTFLLYSNRISPHLGSASATPRILRFLEFSTTINGISIGVSIVIFSLTKMKRDLPPWGQLSQLSAFVNRFLCVFQTHSADDDEVEKGAGNSYQKDWTAAFIALHAVSMTALTLIFILGYFILL